MRAVKANNIAQVQQLIKHASYYGVIKQMVNITSKNGRSPLFEASLHGYTNIVYVLLDAGAEVNQAENSGATPLYAASQNNHLPIVKELASRGADINKVENYQGSSPALMATQEGNIDILKFLIAKGVDVGQKCYHNWTLLHMAAGHNHHSIVELLLKEPKIKKLIDDTSNTRHHTPLTVAINWEGDLEMIKLLMNNGANKEKAGYEGKTPLEWAREMEKSDIVIYLQNF